MRNVRRYNSIKQSNIQHNLKMQILYNITEADFIITRAYKLYSSVGFILKTFTIKKRHMNKNSRDDSLQVDILRSFMKSLTDKRKRYSWDVYL